MIAPSFADIFYNNAFKVGLLPIVISSTALLELISREASSCKEIEVNLINQKILDAMGNELGSFVVESNRRHDLINGLDEIDSTLRMKGSISRFEQQRNHRYPWIEDCAQKLQNTIELPAQSSSLSPAAAKLQW